jgi:hypothetical protein
MEKPFRDLFFRGRRGEKTGWPDEINETIQVFHEQSALHARLRGGELS